MYDGMAVLIQSKRQNKAKGTGIRNVIGSIVIVI